jgi:hypothetical protein
MATMQKIKSYSDANGDGRVYPEVATVYRKDGAVIVVNETGWNGYEQVESFVVATFPTNNDSLGCSAVLLALLVARQVCSHSDLQTVFDRAIDMSQTPLGDDNELKARKEQLYAAIDWKDV